MRLPNFPVALVMASALFLSGAIKSESPNPTPSLSKAGKEEKTDSSAKQGGATDYQCPASHAPVTVNVFPPDDRSKKSQNPCEAHSDPSSTNWWIMLFTGMLAVSAIIQLFIYGRQAHYMSKGLDLTQRAAAAAEKSADTAEASLKSAERAWLTVNFPFPFQPKPDILNEIIYEVENTGRTIAGIKEITVLSSLWEPGKMPTYQFEDSPSTAGLPTIAVVAPNKALRLKARLNIVFAQDVVRKINSGELILDLHGHVIYDDIFNNRHSTRFCYIFTPTGNGIGIFNFPLEAKPDYNDAD
jgi:hypothetical protein